MSAQAATEIDDFSTNCATTGAHDSASPAVAELYGLSLFGELAKQPRIGAVLLGGVGYGALPSIHANLGFNGILSFSSAADPLLSQRLHAMRCPVAVFTQNRQISHFFTAESVIRQVVNVQAGSGSALAAMPTVVRECLDPLRFPRLAANVAAVRCFRMVHAQMLLDPAMFGLVENSK